MKPLEPPDILYLQAAEGWCELHAFAEADAELDNITASLRAHPSVLEVHWQIYANLEKWAGALEIASAIEKMVPDWPSGCISKPLKVPNPNGLRVEALPPGRGDTLSVCRVPGFRGLIGCRRNCGPLSSKTLHGGLYQRQQGRRDTRHNQGRQRCESAHIERILHRLNWRSCCATSGGICLV